MRVGDIVEVRPASEILATLDERGCLEEMPFMPEMLAYCGRQLRISAIAHKTCDTAHRTGGRKLRNTVHLEDVRCDGGAHGGCQATCLIFWRTEWLRRPDARGSSVAPASSQAHSPADLKRHVFASGSTQESPRYSCQATQLFKATEPLAWWDFRQYVCDVTSGNVGLGRALRVLIVAGARSLLKLGVGYRLFTRIYDGVHRLFNGRPAPLGTGSIPLGQPTPSGELGLKAGERVTVLSHDAIKSTLNVGSKNRGMWFDSEMTKFCGKTYEVQGRVDRIINEVTGEMMHMKQPCIVLRGVFCTAEYTDGRLLCRRGVTTYWRENWLERTKT